MGSDLPPWIFTLPDLHEFPEGSHPGPYGIMNPVRRLPTGARLVAVGWLDGPIEFPTGPVNPEVVERLLGLGIEHLIDEGTRGYHTCYYCLLNDNEREVHPFNDRPRSCHSKGHHLVKLEDAVYMCPALLPHYVVVHAYRPPAVFQDAVMRGTFLTDADLEHTGEDYRELVLAKSVAEAEARGDTQAAADDRARIAQRRAELQSAGPTSGFRDPDTGAWRDA